MYRKQVITLIFLFLLGIHLGEEMTFDECMSDCEKRSQKEAEDFKELLDSLVLKPGYYNGPLPDCFFEISSPLQINRAEAGYLTSKAFMYRHSFAETMNDAFWFSIAFASKSIHKLFY